MARKESNLSGGAHRVTHTDKYDNERTAVDVDVDKNGNVVNITDHGKDGSSHSHKVGSDLLGSYSRGDRKK